MIYSQNGLPDLKVRKAKASDAVGCAKLHKRVYPENLLTSKLSEQALEFYYQEMFENMEYCFVFEDNDRLHLILAIGSSSGTIQRKLYIRFFGHILLKLLQNPKVLLNNLRYRLALGKFRPKYSLRLLNLLKTIDRYNTLEQVKMIEKHLSAEGIVGYGHSVHTSNLSAINFHIRNKCIVERFISDRVFFSKSL